MTWRFHFPIRNYDFKKNQNTEYLSTLPSDHQKKYKYNLKRNTMFGPL